MHGGLNTLHNMDYMKYLISRYIGDVANKMRITNKNSPGLLVFISPRI